jgi:hypothetical protein
MPINQSLELQAVYQAAGRHVKFVNMHGSAHGGAEFYDAARLQLVDAFLGEVLSAPTREPTSTR